MEVLLLSLIKDYPLISSILVVVGGLRIVFKPLMLILKNITIYTVSKKDDALLSKLVGSKIYKGVSWLLDYLASVKLDKLINK